MIAEIDIQRVMGQIEVKAAKETKRISTDLFKKIVTRNPVDTGFSSKNWNATLGKADTSVRGDRDKLDIPGAPQSDLDQIKDMSKTIHLANGVDYIRDLENGSSKQAPGGFVALSVAEVVSHES